MINYKLLPCPFCGGKAFIDPIFHQTRKNYPYYARVMCERCQASVGDTGFSNAPETAEAKAVKAWNRRTGLMPERASELARAESEGRLVVLPCKVGDTVYQTDGIRTYASTIKNVIYETDSIAFDGRAIGESIFLTHEEAERALKGGPSE